jgi:hypothetical protein
MNFLKHMSENLFISFTGIAALVHSTWALGTMFSGEMPTGDYWAMAWWGIPAFFVAFAMDIGQISTSADIRHKGLTWQRATTFSVFAIATYYLQFLYIAHHMPSLDIALGVSDWHKWAVTTARDAAIWVLPLLLPLSTMLYTISDSDNRLKEKEGETEGPVITISKQEQPLIAEKNTEITGSIMVAEEIIQEPKYAVYCEDCGWANEFLSEKTAKRSLTTHKTLHCKKQPDKVIQNGHVN